MQVHTTNRNASATKRGPGRFHEQGHNKAKPNTNKAPKEAGQYGKALAGYIARKQAQKQAKRKLHPLRDEHGVITMTGRREPLYFADKFFPAKTLAKWTPGRHVCLAGISAQRGY